MQEPMPTITRSSVASQQRDIITGPGAWIGSEIQRDESWIYRLDAAAVAEIDAALARAKSVGARIPFTKDAFPLPRLGAELDSILEEIESERWFVEAGGKIVRAPYERAAARRHAAKKRCA
jgi:hypothetical protein